MIDDTKLEEAILALLGVFADRDGRTWKRYDFAVMEALAEKELITDPRGRAESVFLTEAGKARAAELAARLFGKTKE
jgi:hypothetical protein